MPTGKTIDQQQTLAAASSSSSSFLITCFLSLSLSFARVSGSSCYKHRSRIRSSRRTLLAEASESSRILLFFLLVGRSSRSLCRHQPAAKWFLRLSLCRWDASSLFLSFSLWFLSIVGHCAVVSSVRSEARFPDLVTLIVGPRAGSPNRGKRIPRQPRLTVLSFNSACSSTLVGSKKIGRNLPGLFRGE